MIFLEYLEVYYEKGDTKNCFASITQFQDDLSKTNLHLAKTAKRKLFRTIVDVFGNQIRNGPKILLVRKNKGTKRKESSQLTQIVKRLRLN